MRLALKASTTIQKIKVGGKVKKITNNFKLIDPITIYCNELTIATTHMKKITLIFATLL